MLTDITNKDKPDKNKKQRSIKLRPSAIKPIENSDRQEQTCRSLIQNMKRKCIFFYANPRLSFAPLNLAPLNALSREMRYIISLFNPFDFVVQPATTVNLFEQSLSQFKPEVVVWSGHTLPWNVIGLKWHKTNVAPSSGDKLTNPELVDALKSKLESSGLAWHKIGKTRPSKGTELTNEKLAKALQTKLEFGQVEWDAFGVKGITIDHFIKAGDSYFQPVVDFTQAEWDKFDMKDLTMTHFIKVGSDYFQPIRNDSHHLVFENIDGKVTTKDATGQMRIDYKNLMNAKNLISKLNLAYGGEIKRLKAVILMGCNTNLIAEELCNEFEIFTICWSTVTEDSAAATFLQGLVNHLQSTKNINGKKMFEMGMRRFTENKFIVGDPHAINVNPVHGIPVLHEPM